MLTLHVSILGRLPFPIVFAWTVFALAGCAGPRTEPRAGGSITVAAAANLTEAFDQAAKDFTSKTGIQVIYSYGATAQLAEQIRNAAPFDVFAAADKEHVDRLIGEGKLTAGSRAIYARGQLVLWIPRGEASGIRTIDDLTDPKVRFIAIAKPELAPYGAAAVDALKALKLWQRIEPKVAYANSISMARQFARTGNADAAFTAYSLVLKEGGTVLRIDQKLYSPLDQALATVTSTSKSEQAQKFRDFVLGESGRAILSRYGYILP